MLSFFVHRLRCAPLIINFCYQSNILLFRIASTVPIVTIPNHRTSFPPPSYATMKLSTAATAMIVSATMLSFPAEVAAKNTDDKFEATDERLKVLELEKKIEVVDIKMDEVKSMIARLLEQKQSANPASKASKQGKGGSHSTSTTKASKNAKAANFGYHLSRGGSYSMSISIEPTFSPATPTVTPTTFPTLNPTVSPPTLFPMVSPPTTAKPTFGSTPTVRY